jgi:hypothetical protein
MYSLDVVSPLVALGFLAVLFKMALSVFATAQAQSSLWQIFVSQMVKTKLTGRLTACILLQFPGKFSGHFGRHLDVGGADP